MDISSLIQKTRRRLLEMHYRAHAGHIGPNLSALDCMVTLFHRVKAPDDNFILSKGHAAGAFYVTLWSLGQLSDAELDTFCQNGTRLAGHPHGELPSLLFPTGSIGHGPGLACGLALGARRQGSGRHIWCLCGDGEWQEGACWESLIFAVHHKLDNLTLIIDNNGLQGFGTTNEVASMGNLKPRFQAFDCVVTVADGHDAEAIEKALGSGQAGKPSVVLLNTIKGRGLSNEGKVSCHYLPLSEGEYSNLMKEGDHA